MHNFNFFEAFRFASNCNTNLCGIWGLNSSGIMASIFIILKWYFSDRCLWYYCFSRFFIVITVIFLSILEMIHDERPSTKCVFVLSGIWKHEDSAWLCCQCCITYIRIKTEFSGISLFNHPSHIHQLRLLVKMNSWEMLPWILLTAFYCLRQENKGI